MKIKKYLKSIFSNTLFKISLIRDLKPCEVKEYRTELLYLARWICEYFGFKIVKNKPEQKIKDVTVIYKGDIATVSRMIRVDKTWISRFRGKATELRKQNPHKYKNRTEGMRCN